MMHTKINKVTNLPITQYVYMKKEATEGGIHKKYLIPRLTTLTTSEKTL